eukprot:TRINITY_DN1700_c0_g1_i2.p1 TRINITY_DN1700_c0_g1~~TRINITY_DN1700_c0_g1_i2.p1  ORF type:complete len:503 (-),score=70.28 TRINITY_DN1700_c0_g1_i2:126-1634(-)
MLASVSTRKHHTSERSSSKLWALPAGILASAALVETTEDGLPKALPPSNGRPIILILKDGDIQALQAQVGKNADVIRAADVFSTRHLESIPSEAYAICYYLSPKTSKLEVYLLPGSAVPAASTPSLITFLADIKNGKLPATNLSEQASAEKPTYDQPYTKITRETFDSVAQGDKDALVLLYMLNARLLSQVIDVARMFSDNPSIVVGVMEGLLNVPFPPSLNDTKYNRALSLGDLETIKLYKKGQSQPITYEGGLSIKDLCKFVCTHLSQNREECIEHQRERINTSSLLDKTEFFVQMLLTLYKQQFNMRKSKLRKYRADLVEIIDSLHGVEAAFIDPEEDQEEVHEAAVELEHDVQKLKRKIEARTLKGVVKIASKDPEDWNETLDKAFEKAKKSPDPRVVVFGSMEDCPTCMKWVPIYGSLATLMPQIRFLKANIDVLGSDAAPRFYVYDATKGRASEQQLSPAEFYNMSLLWYREYASKQQQQDDENEPASVGEIGKTP